MKGFRRILEADIFRSLLFAFAVVLSAWPFLSEGNTIPFRSMLIFFFVGWLVLVALLFLIGRVLGTSDLSGD